MAEGNSIYVPVPYGEFIDRLSILYKKYSLPKNKHYLDSLKLFLASYEKKPVSYYTLELVEDKVTKLLSKPLERQLDIVNSILWGLEETVRKYFTYKQNLEDSENALLNLSLYKDIQYYNGLRQILKVKLSASQSDEIIQERKYY